MEMQFQVLYLSLHYLSFTSDASFVIVHIHTKNIYFIKVKVKKSLYEAKENKK